ncbi:cell wall protein DAN4 isoform X2 [Nilaparvata lugens]|uniref:cell wall protein DAN4 isoform X2 n=1 Tax=Nilaparvata lugens TaxID=108931 RepID=UPI00193E8593|nr:cell wall protein DAN4 isoform X2 [Nilaparvata lugens]
MQTVTFVSKIPSSFKFSSKTLPPTKVSPKKEVNKPSSSSSSSKKSVDPQVKASIKKPNFSKSFSSSRKESMTTKTSPKNTSLNRISETKQLALRKAFSNIKMNLSSAKTPAKNINFSIKKNKPVRMSINNKKISKNMSMEVKSSSSKKTPLALNKSMPAKISSSLTKTKPAQAKATNQCESNARSADKSTVKTPASKGNMKVDQTSFIKTSNGKVITQEKSGTQKREMRLEVTKMSYSSAVKRKPVNKQLLPKTSKADDLKPVTIPRNIMIQVNKKPAFSNRHINSPDPIIISKQSLKSLGNRSVKKDLRKPMKSNTPKQTFKPSARPNLVPSSVRTPRASASKILPQKISNKVNDAVKTPMILKSNASTSKLETSRSKRNLNANKSSIADDSSTPSVVGIKYISMKNESLLKSSMKQERGLISCKKVNFDMSHLNLKSSQADKKSSISSDIRNVKDTSVNSEEPSKCFLAALELSCDSFMDGTTIISSPMKRTRRSSVKSQHIHASTPIQSARQVDWLVNTPSSRMLMLHPSHSKSPAPGTSKALDFSASNTVSNSSKSNDTTHNLPYCEVYLTPHISTDTLNISVENFVSPLTQGALGLNLKNASRLSSSQTRKSVTKPVSDSLEVFNSTSNSTRQSLNRSQTRSAAKASYPTKSPKNNLQDVSGVKQIFTRKSPGNDLRKNLSGVKRLLSSEQNSPKNDLRDVRGVKKLLSTPKIQKSPNNDLRDVRGVKKLLSPPKAQKSPKNDLRDVRGVKKMLSSPKAQKSPKNDLRDVRGVKKLLSPKVQKSPKNDLRDVRGVKKLLSSPKAQKSPKNDLRDVRGVKKMLSSPKAQKSPKNDLRDVRGVKKLLSPKAQKSPKNDLRDVRGVKKLLSSPKSQKSPTNDLRDVMGVKRLLLTQKDPKNDLRNVSGLNLLMATPSKCSPKIEKITRDQKPTLANRGEVKVDVESPKNNQIKTECDVQPTKRKAEVTKEVPAKRKVKQEMSSPTIKPQDKQVVQRRTRRNVNELKNEESESSDLQVESKSSSRKKSTARKTSSKSQVNADAAVTAKPRASKRTTKNVAKETRSAVTQSGKKSAEARRSSGSSKLRSNMRKRKSSGVLVVSAKKVQFNPEVKSSGGKRKTKKTENSEGESLSEKETPSRSRRSTKTTTKSTEVKPTRGTRGAVAETSSEGTSGAAKPLKAKRATRTTKDNAAT